MFDLGGILPEFPPFPGNRPFIGMALWMVEQQEGHFTVEVARLETAGQSCATPFLLLRETALLDKSKIKGKSLHRAKGSCQIYSAWWLPVPFRVWKDTLASTPAFDTVSTFLLSFSLSRSGVCFGGHKIHGGAGLLHAYTYPLSFYPLVMLGLDGRRQFNEVRLLLHVIGSC